MAFKKGDRVLWEGQDGKEHHGTVTRGGKYIKAVADGGMVEVSGPADIFDHSRKSAAVESTVMEAYSVVKYKSLGRGMEGEMFKAELHRNGVKIADIINEGRGGGNNYRPTNGKLGELVVNAEKLAEDWAKNAGDDNPFESLDLWVAWYLSGRAFGQTSKEFFAAIRSHVG